ncbi:MAG: hypothetical protein RL662_471 [Bacteroidota bacterium]|jgi:hypothetical protein
MNQLGEFFLDLQGDGFFEENSKLSLLDIPTKKDLLKGNIPHPANDQLLLFGAAEYADIPIETHFDVIIPYRKMEEYVYARSILIYITVNPSYEINFLPKGYSVICLLEFTEGKPDILNKLAIYGDKKDYYTHDILILTQKLILEEILIRMKKYK